MVKLELELWELYGMIHRNSLCHFSFSLPCLFLSQWQNKTKVKAEDNTEKWGTGREIEHGHEIFWKYHFLEVKHISCGNLSEENNFDVWSSFSSWFSVNSIQSSTWMNLDLPIRIFPLTWSIFNSETIKSLLELCVASLTTHYWAINSLH